MKIINIASKDWIIKEGFSTMGRRDKFWVEKDEDEFPVYLFKQPKESAKVEIWTEIIAFKLGELFQVNVPKEVQPAKYKNDYGVLVKSFLAPGESLLHAQDLLKYFNSNSNYYHNIYSVKKILEYSEVGGWLDFKKLLIFDCYNVT